MSHKPTISEIRAHNEQIGHYFFSRKTMRVWGSKVLPTVNAGPGGVYFVTSEKDWTGRNRVFSVRRYNPETGDVRTAYDGKKHESTRHHNVQDARALAQYLAQHGEPTE